MDLHVEVYDEFCAMIAQTCAMIAHIEGNSVATPWNPYDQNQSKTAFDRNLIGA
jgi:hypothetical protein